MAARKSALILIGLILLLLGTVFALQGANYIRGSALMSGNPTYIYVGSALALVGLILVKVGIMSRSKGHPASMPTGASQ